MCPKAILTLIILVLSPQIFSAECLLSRALTNSKLSNNQDFWNEYTAQVASGKSSDEAVRVLSKKYDPTFGEGASVSMIPAPFKATPVFNLDIHKRARREIDRLPATLKKKVDGFLEVAMQPGGIKELYDNPGKWHFEKLAQFGPDAHSVRLNEGYRVLFDIKDGDFIVREVNKGHIHGQ